MSKSIASLIGALAASTLLAWSGHAAAEPADLLGLGAGYTAADAPLGAATELAIDLRGRVAARCELTTPPAEMTQLALGRSGQAQTAFALDCNTPFLMRVRSGAGGFRNDEATVGVEPMLPYEISVAVDTDEGRQDLGWCDASALTDMPGKACAYAPTAAGRGWSSGEAIAIDQKGQLRLRWSDNASERPLLGAYRDIIVIELEVRS